MNWNTIKQRRKYLGLSQKDIADRLGMSRARYNRIERGYGSISLSEFEILIGVLGYEVKLFVLSPNGINSIPVD